MHRADLLNHVNVHMKGLWCCCGFKYQLQMKLFKKLTCDINDVIPTGTVF